MTDTTNIADTTPGVRGQTRSTWRDESHLRGLLLKLIRQHPDATRDGLEDLFLGKAKGPSFHAKPAHEALIDEALRRAFDNDFNEIHKAYRRRRKPVRFSDEEATAAEHGLATVVLLDLVMPNGKKLRDCTGDEAGEAGGWLLKVKERVGASSATRSARSSWRSYSLQDDRRAADVRDSRRPDHRARDRSRDAARLGCTARLKGEEEKKWKRPREGTTVPYSS